MAIPPDPEPDEPVPLLGSWARLYAAVLASALAVMGLLALFSHWSW
jgi:hypothetical protein